jgi:transcription elongation factor SPT6
VVKEKLIERLQCCLVDAVADAGVDVNKAVKFEHHSQLLAFIPGLGLRKAESLKQQIQRSVGSIESKESLLTLKLLGKIVWNNMCGFLKIKVNSRISDVLVNPLEATRIHPECYLMYDFAPKICADALGIESNPSKYSEIVAKLMKSVKGDLEKRINKFPEWLDLWEKGERPEYFIEGNDQLCEVGNNKITVELYDCLSVLILDEYVQELENRGKGKRRIQFELIKEELRYPWLDLRKPLTSIHSSELFDIIYGESQFSLFVGLKIGFTIVDFQDQTYSASSLGNEDIIRRRQRMIVRTDSGIKGFVSSFEIDDNRVDGSNLQLRDRFHVGQHLLGAVVGINKEKFFVDLSIRPSILDCSEAWWIENRNVELRAKRYWESVGKDPSNLFDVFFNEKKALSLYKTIEDQNKIKLYQQSSAAPPVNDLTGRGFSSVPTSASSSVRSHVSRVIYHPLFANVDYREAEEKLRSEGKGAGAVLVRPSSRGSNHLALTWAFQENWFKHINIEEYGKRPGELGLGNKLVIREENLEFSDLDELYAMYIEPMNDLVSAMTKHKNFRFGSPDEVEKEMREQLKLQPGRIPYLIRFDPNKPGTFVLTWLQLASHKATEVKSLKVDVRSMVSFVTRFYSLSSAVFFVVFHRFRVIELDMNPFHAQVISSIGLKDSMKDVNILLFSFQLSLLKKIYSLAQKPPF